MSRASAISLSNKIGAMLKCVFGHGKPHKIQSDCQISNPSYNTYWSICSCISKSPRSSSSFSKIASSPSATRPETSITWTFDVSPFIGFHLGLILHLLPFSFGFWFPEADNQILAHTSSMIPHLNGSLLH